MFDKLLQKLSLKEFDSAFFLKVPYSEPDSAAFLKQHGDLDMLRRLYATAGADVICGKADGSQLPAEDTQRQDIQQVLAAGYTIGIRHAERHDPWLGELAQAFRRDFGNEVDLHLYCTPANQSGFGWHYDAEDVFIIQTAGSKEWSLRKNSVNPWPLMENLPANMRYEREIMPLFRCTLQAGDWLYIPHGYWHKTESRELSISLSIGLNSPTGLTVYDALRQDLLDSLRWRQRLPSPLAKSDEEYQQELRAHLQELGSDLQKIMNSPRFLANFYQQRLEQRGKSK
jgi:50S ribosomal protein L16 3-hydroxylase